MARNTVLIRSIAPPVAGSTDFQKLVCVWGVSSIATGREEFSASEARDVSRRLGFGNLAEAVRTLLEYGSADIKVVAVPVEIGTMGAPSWRESKEGKATIAATGKSYDAYEIILEIVKGGDKSKASYKISLDNGRSWFPEKTFAGDLEVVFEKHESDDSNADLKLTFTESSTASESFVSGDRYTTLVSSATATDQNIRKSIEAISATYPDGNYLIAQAVETSEWMAYQTLLKQLLKQQNLVRMSFNAPSQVKNQTLTNWSDALAAKAKELNEPRLSIVAAFAPIPHTSGLQLKPLVGGAALLEATLSKAPVHHNIAWVGGYPLPINQIFPVSQSAGVSQDLGEAYLKTLDQAGLITYQRHRRINGVRFADDNTVFAGGGGKTAFKIHQGRVEDKATALMLTLITQTLNKAVDPDQLAELGARVESLIANQMIKIPEPNIQSIIVEFKGNIDDLEIVLNLGGIPTVGDITVTRKLTEARWIGSASISSATGADATGGQS